MSKIVLYIDDKQELPDNVEGLLEQTGYRLVHTADPEEALRLVREEEPALVLIEVLLPNCDAFDLLEQMGCSNAESSLSVVIVTRGERTSELYGRAVEMGAKDFLCKPIVRAQILEAVLEYANSEDPKTENEAEPESAPRDFEGDLSDQPLPELIGRLYRSGLSGVLRLRHQSGARGIQFRNGSPIEVERHGDLIPIADFLLETNRLNQTQYEMLVDQLMAGLEGPRAILLGMNAMSEAKLVAATSEQARGVFLEMFEWSVAEFSFKEGQSLEGTDNLELTCDPMEILSAGLERSPKTVIQNAIDERGHFYVSLSETAKSAMEDLNLSREQRVAAQALTGEHTLVEILDSSTLDPITVYALCAAGAVELLEYPVLMLVQEILQEPAEGANTVLELDVLMPELPRQTSEDAPIDAMPEAPATPEAVINAIAERMNSLDDIDLFDIGEATTDADVHLAYDSMLTDLRLENIPPELDELHALAKKLKERLEQAYQRVRTKDTRLAFAGLRNKKHADNAERRSGSRAVEAENWFRTGKTALANEDYRKAAEAFGMAMHCDPEQGDYTAHLGFALFRTDPNNTIIRREALEHVAKGVKLAPDRGTPLLFLGRIFRETGDLGMAAKILRRALKIDPDNPAIVQEMCLVTAGGKKTSKNGFLARLRGR